MSAKNLKCAVKCVVFFMLACSFMILGQIRFGQPDFQTPEKYLLFALSTLCSAVGTWMFQEIE